MGGGEIVVGPPITNNSNVVGNLVIVLHRHDSESTRNIDVINICVAKVGSCIGRFIVCN